MANNNHLHGDVRSHDTTTCLGASMQIVLGRALGMCHLNNTYFKKLPFVDPIYTWNVFQLVIDAFELVPLPQLTYRKNLDFRNLPMLLSFDMEIRKKKL